MARTFSPDQLEEVTPTAGQPPPASDSSGFPAPGTTLQRPGKSPLEFAPAVGYPQPTEEEIKAYEDRQKVAAKGPDFKAQQFARDVLKRTSFGLSEKFLPESILPGEKEDVELYESTEPELPKAIAEGISLAGPGLAYKAGGKIAGKLITKGATEGLKRTAAREFIAGTIGTGVGAGAKAATGESDIKEAGVETGIGALVSGAIPVAGATASKALDYTGRGLRKLSRLQAFKSIGAMLKDYRESLGNNRLEKIGKWVIDKDIAPAGSSYDDVARRATIEQRRIGKELNAIQSPVQEIMNDQNKLLEVGKILNKTPEEILATRYRPKTDTPMFVDEISKKYKGDIGYEAAVKRLEGLVEDLVSNGDDVSIKRMVDLKGQVDDQINYTQLNVKKGSDASFETPLYKKMLIDLRNKIESKIAGHVDTFGKVLPKSTADALRKANREYGLAATTKRISTDRALREQAKNMFGLAANTAVGVGVVGNTILQLSEGDIDDVIKGAAVGGGALIGSKMLRRYGPALLTQSLRMAGEVARHTKKIPDAVKNNPEFLQALSYKILEKTDLGKLVKQPRSFKQDDLEFIQETK